MDSDMNLRVPSTPSAYASLAGHSGNTALSAALSPRDPSAKIATNHPSMLSSSTSHMVTRYNGHAPAANTTRRAPPSPTPTPTDAPVKANTGRWTEAEHKLFLQGLETFPYRAWKKIATLIKTRTVVQIRTHAQKYYQKLEKEQARLRERQEQGGETESDVSSLPRKKHMMRKRKTPTDAESENPYAKRVTAKRSTRKSGMEIPESARSSNFPRPYNPIEPVPESMVLDFEEKPLLDYPLPMDDSVDHSLQGIDSEELLQLTDEDTLDWLSSSTPISSANMKPEKMDVEPTPLELPMQANMAMSFGSCAPLCDSPVSPSLTTDFGSTFVDCFEPTSENELDTAALLNNADYGADFVLNEDDDFVLDPEKFLSSYLSPTASTPC